MNVLIIDDDARFLAEAAALFQELGHTVTSVKDGKSGLEAFLQGKFGLVLIDALLPRLSGEELVREIAATKKGANTPCILMSGIYKQRATQLELQQKSGAKAFLSKPLNREKVQALVQEFGVETNTEISSGFSILPGELTTDTKLSPAQTDQFLGRGAINGLSPYKTVWLIHMHQKSGVLELHAADKKSMVVHFSQGEITHIDSSDHKFLFGQLLVSQGYIKQEDLDRTITSLAKGERTGKALVDRALISPHVIDEIMYFQQFERLGILADWKLSRFKFTEGPAESGQLSFSLLEIIHEIIFSRYSFDALKNWAKQLRQFEIIPVRGAVTPSKWVPSQEDQVILSSLSSGATQTVWEWVKKFSKNEERAVRLLMLMDVFDMVRFGTPGLKDSYQDSAEQMALEYEEMNYFERLGLTKDATIEDVKERFRALTKEYHPDALGETATPVTKQAYQHIFHYITEAYEALSSESSLEQYKKFGKLVSGEDRATAEQEFGHGKRNFLRKNYGVAKQHFERAFQINPEKGLYLAYLCWTEIYLQDKGASNYNEVMAALFAKLQKAQKLAPKDVVPSLVMGNYFKTLGQMQKAEHAFRDALDIDPENRDAQREIRLLTLREAEKDKKEFKVFGIKIR